MKVVQVLAARSAGAASIATARNTLRTSTCRFSMTATRDVARCAAQVPLRVSHRSFTSSTFRPKGLSPDSSDPKPPNTESSHAGLEAADISDAEYHEIADQYMNTLVLTLEELADGEKGSEGVEVEYSAGVLTVGHPSKGTYVLNKQPPNKQIWLSSPVSGPKRFDWTIPKTAGGGMNSKQDQEDSHGDVGDTGVLGGGKWTYLRDGSTLSEILKDELGVIVAQDEDADALVGREGPGGSGVGGGRGAAGGVEG